MIRANASPARPLAPSPARENPPTALLIFTLLALAFALVYQLGVPLRATHSARVNVDEPFYLLTTVSLIEDGDLDLANDYALRRYRAYFDHPQELWYQSVPTEDGRVLSPHNVGTSILVLPAYAPGGVDGVKRFLAALGGLVVGLAAAVAYRASGRLWPSILAAALVGASAPLFVYSTQIYPEMPAALLVALCAYVLLARSPGHASALVLALGLSGLAWLGTKYVLVGSVLGLVALARLETPGRLLLAAVLLPSAALYAWFHLAVYGDLTPYAVNSVYAGSDTLELVGLHLEVANRLYRLLGLWVDGEFGLLRWAPVLALALPGAVIMARRPGPGRWLLLVFTAQFLVAAFLTITMRGWWFPGRMLIAVLPLLAVPLAEALAAARGRPLLAAATALLGAYTAGVTLALRGAVAAEQVVLAVDPFALAWPPFRALAPLFPVYTSYEPLTWLLTGGWLLGAGALALVGVRLAGKERERPPVRPEMRLSAPGALE